MFKLVSILILSSILAACSVKQQDVNLTDDEEVIIVSGTSLPPEEAFKRCIERRQTHCYGSIVVVGAEEISLTGKVKVSPGIVESFEETGSEEPETPQTSEIQGNQRENSQEKEACGTGEAVVINGTLLQMAAP